MAEYWADHFPLRRHDFTPGSRRLAREKVLQVVTAFLVCGEPLEKLIEHIFYRKFNFGEYEEKSERLLTPDEIVELESDKPISWLNPDLEYGEHMIYGSLRNREFADTLLEKNSKNWDIDRIALIDRVLIYMAVTELLDFEDIPIKVTISEILDIAKDFSTDKSNSFINGLLDVIVNDLNDQGRIKKVGKGLSEKSIRKPRAKRKKKEL